MARRFYRLLWGFKEHPETFRERGFPLELKPGQTYPVGYKDVDEHQLLYPGDCFDVEEALILRPGALGGWMDVTLRARDGVEANTWILECAEPVPDAKREQWVTRDTPSRIEGYNISAQQLAEIEAREAAESHILSPRPDVAADAPPSVKTIDRPGPRAASPGPPPEPRFRPPTAT